MTKSTFTKTKAQIKSYQYYIFWGACTFAVMAGQIFVGAGYQSMSNSVRSFTDSDIYLYPVPTYICPAITAKVQAPQNK